jgi:putative transposase
LIDLATRMVVGWQTASHVRTSLIVDAVAMAIDAGHVRRDAVFHSNHGANTHRPSSPRSADANTSGPASAAPACAGDNAAAESFFSTLTNKMYHHHQYFDTRVEARFAIAEYIEIFYNGIRLHSTVGCRTPAGVLAEFTTQPIAA